MTSQALNPCRRTPLNSCAPPPTSQAKDFASGVDELGPFLPDLSFTWADGLSGEGDRPPWETQSTQSSTKIRKGVKDTEAEAAHLEGGGEVAVKQLLLVLLGFALAWCRRGCFAANCFKAGLKKK